MNSRPEDAARPAKPAIRTARAPAHGALLPQFIDPQRSLPLRS
jgi:hypothetical protein